MVYGSGAGGFQCLSEDDVSPLTHKTIPECHQECEIEVRE